MRDDLAPLRLAVLDLPIWEAAEGTAREAFEDFVSTNPQIEGRISLSHAYDAAWDWHATLQWSDIATNFAPLFERCPDEATPKLREMMATGAKYRAVEYNRARVMQTQVAAHLEQLLEGFDALVTLAAPGPAPKGLSSTGNPVFNSLATYAGLPAVSLPLLEVSGLPLGLQLIARRREDARLLNTARRFVEAQTS